MYKGPALVYGLECWALTRGQMRDIEHCQTRALRWLARSPAHLYNESNEELRQRLQVPTVESWLRLARLRWLRSALRKPAARSQAPVSYTHRTLPTS